MKQTVIIGTRGSKLALWQAHFTRDTLIEKGFEVEIKIIKTKGDKIQHLSFDKIEGKGFFTKEIEDALLAKEVDLAVHSCKDLPTNSPPGLAIVAYSKRAAANDVLLIRKENHAPGSVLEIKENGVVGTSSARRKVQLKSFRNDISIKDIRGNVPTRIGKLRSGNFDAIVLAAAGLNRLQPDISDLIRLDLPCTQFIPAPAQGVLAFQTRDDDEKTIAIAKLLSNEATTETIAVEREILNQFQGGCQMPLGVYVQKEKEIFHTWVSKSINVDALPIRKHFQLDNNAAQKQIASIVENFSALKKSSVFITRNPDEKGYFYQTLTAQGNTVKEEALIDFKAIDFEVSLDQYDWLFFCSKNGVRYFFDKVKALPENLKIAAINKGSEQVLKQLGFEPDFAGDGGDLKAIAKDFDETIGNKVAVVRAKVSNRTIQKNLNKKEVADVIVYENFKKEVIQERNENILVFTSPMNVEAYFEKYKLKSNQQLVAIGPTTAKSIQSFSYTCQTAYEPTMWALVDVVFGLL